MADLVERLNSLTGACSELSRVGDFWALYDAVDDVTILGTDEQIESYLLEQISKAERV